jgi:uncharacterized membrane protein YdjX (TVP38/TMEM64 family)
MTSGEPAKKRLSIARLAPLIVIALGAVAGFWLFGDYLSFEALSANRERLLEWRDANYALAAVSYMGVYVLATAFSIPGAVWLTLAGGFMFGAIPNILLAAPAATLGASAIFLAAKTGLGDALRARAGPFMRKVEAGLRENEVSYLLLIRLVPAVPFWVANLAPAFFGVRLGTFVWTTFVGIIPGGLVYSWVGAGLGEVFARGEAPDLGVIFEPQILAPILGLAALAALPILIKLIRGRGV